MTLSVYLGTLVVEMLIYQLNVLNIKKGICVEVKGAPQFNLEIDDGNPVLFCFLLDMMLKL